MHEFEDDAGGVAVNWVVFGSSGVQKRPQLNTLSSYWMCAPPGHSENLHIKSIVQPERVAGITTDPHHFKYKPPYTAVNTAHDVVKGPKSERHLIDRLALYHYAVKSEEEFAAKMARGSGTRFRSDWKEHIVAMWEYKGKDNSLTTPLSQVWAI